MQADTEYQWKAHRTKSLGTQASIGLLPYGEDAGLVGESSPCLLLDTRDLGAEKVQSNCQALEYRHLVAEVVAVGQRQIVQVV